MRHDHHLTVTLGRTVSDFFVIRRPHVATFLKEISKWYNVSIFTAGVKEYADPLITLLDTDHVVQNRYFRPSCSIQKDAVTGLECFVKDFANVGASPDQTVIIDNQPASYARNKESGLPIDHFFDDPTDDALLSMVSFLKILRHVNDVRSILGLHLHRITKSE